MIFRAFLLLLTIPSALAGGISVPDPSEKAHSFEERLRSSCQPLFISAVDLVHRGDSRPLTDLGLLRFAIQVGESGFTLSDAQARHLVGDGTSSNLHRLADHRLLRVVGDRKSVGVRYAITERGYRYCEILEHYYQTIKMSAPAHIPFRYLSLPELHVLRKAILLNGATAETATSRLQRVLSPAQVLSALDLLVAEAYLIRKDSEYLPTARAALVYEGWFQMTRSLFALGVQLPLL